MVGTGTMVGSILGPTDAPARLGDSRWGRDSWQACVCDRRVACKPPKEKREARDEMMSSSAAHGRSG